jgi:hypothetical protein
MVRSIQSSGEAGDHAGDHRLGPALCTVKPEIKTDFTVTVADLPLTSF